MVLIILTRHQESLSVSDVQAQAENAMAICLRRHGFSNPRAKENLARANPDTAVLHRLPLTTSKNSEPSNFTRTRQRQLSQIIAVHSFGK